MTRVLALVATIPPRRASCERLLAELAQQSRPPDGVILCLDGYGHAPAPACPLPVVATYRTPAPSGPGQRWGVAERLAAVARYRELLSDLLSRRELEGDLPQEVEDPFTDALDRCWHVMTAEQRSSMEPIPPQPALALDDILVVIDDDAMLDEAPRFIEALALILETTNCAAAALGYTPAGHRAPPGAVSRGRLVLACGCGLALRAGHLEGLRALAEEVRAAGGPEALGPCGDDQALVSAHLWRKGVLILHAATGPLSFAPGTQQESQTRARQARGEQTLFEQAQAIARITGWPFPTPVVEVEEQPALSWEEELSAVPGGAVRARGAVPAEGHRRVLVVDGEEPDRSGVYDVPLPLPLPVS